MKRYCVMAILLAITGCSDQGVNVTGTVNYGDSPLVLGIIAIEPQAGSGTTGAGATVGVSNGQFQFPPEKQLKPGKYIVRISPPEIGSGTDLKNMPPLFPSFEKELELKPGMEPLHFDVPAMKKK